MALVPLFFLLLILGVDAASDVLNEAEIALEHFHKREFPQARELYAKVLAAGPESPANYYNLAITEVGQRERKLNCT